MKSAVFLLLVISVAPAAAQTCADGWCLTFPVGDVKPKPPFGSSAWNKLIYIPDDSRFFIYSSDGIYTFSNSWWSYGVLGHPATSNPWIEESTSGTVQPTVTDNSKAFLKSAIGPTDETISVRNGEGKNFHTDPARGGILIIGNEEIEYAVAKLNGDTFTSVKRGVRGTIPTSHVAGAMINAGAPFPQSRRDGKLVPVNDHPPDRHPFLTAAYDSHRHQLFQAGGIVEGNKLTDTWYFCLVANEFCAQSDVRVWKRLISHTSVPARADSAMTYDTDDDVMILYGGQSVGNPTADTWLLYFKPDPQNNGNNVGCPASGSYPDWVLVSSAIGSTKGSPGPRFAHSIVYDSSHRVAILFGGTNGSATDPADTWLYKPSTRTWADMKPKGSNPNSFRRPAMAYDSTRKQVVLYEGPPGKIAGGITGGLYFYDAEANAWELSVVQGGPIPSSPENSLAHGRLTLDYDSKTDTFVATEAGPSYSIQVWELKGAVLDRAKATHAVQ